MILLQNLKNSIRMGVGIILTAPPRQKFSIGGCIWLKIQLSFYYNSEFNYILFIDKG